MIKAIFLDFYGTVVHEDDEIIPIICKQIHSQSMIQNEVSIRQIGGYWSDRFFTLVNESYGDKFRTQRDLELTSIQETLLHFASDCDPIVLSQILFDHWARPAIYEDSLQFLNTVKLPVYILSNIDRSEIKRATAYHNVTFASVITSEDVQSYKPRAEIFISALREAHLEPHEVLHVGDSVTSDVAGACRLSIPVAWINRTDKVFRGEYTPDYVIKELTDIMAILSS